MSLEISVLFIVVGLTLLIWGAGRFVASASNIAVIFHIPPLLIGIIVIGFGTSTPELLVSSLAAYDGLSGLALGNVFGSNIINIGFILGLTALIAPISVHSKIVRQEIPFLFFCGALIGWQFYDSEISRFDGLVSLAIFGMFVGYGIFESLKAPHDPLATDVEQELESHRMSATRAWLILIVGLVALLIGSKLLVEGASFLAKYFGVSDLIIGLTIVALGTSLPELTTSVIAALRKEPDLAIGNVVGSNIFNLLAVIGTAALITPMTGIAPEKFVRDWAVMMGFVVILSAVCLGIKKAGRISRLEGGLLLAAVMAYNIYLIGGQT